MELEVVTDQPARRREEATVKDIEKDNEKDNEGENEEDNEESSLGTAKTTYKLGGSGGIRNSSSLTGHVIWSKGSSDSEEEEPVTKNTEVKEIDETAETDESVESAEVREREIRELEDSLERLREERKVCSCTFASFYFSIASSYSCSFAHSCLPG